MKFEESKTETQKIQYFNNNISLCYHYNRHIITVSCYRNNMGNSNIIAALLAANDRRSSADGGSSRRRTLFTNAHT